MADNKQEMIEFEFPDEAEAKGKPVEEAADIPEIEVEDDTPAEDRGRQPLPKEVVEKLDQDELDKYEGETKEKFKQLKKVWHDERRAKEAAYREQQEALALAKKLVEENKALKAKVNSGQDVIISAAKEAAERELELAKREYREAYEAGDTDRLIEAQEKMTAAKLKSERADLYKSEKEAYQKDEIEVQIPQQQQSYAPDTKAQAWQERNSWFGQDEEMTSLALGLHEKLVKTHGASYATTNEYYDTIDKTMRRRFPEYFEETESGKEAKDEEPQKVARSKPSTVVAPATRSTSPKKIRLSTTQVQLAKKLGLTPEQYARELTKLEAQNG